MKISKKWSISILIIVILLIGVLIYLSIKRPYTNRLIETADTRENQNSIEAPSSVPDESKILSHLLISWLTTQSKFSVKAGEGGIYNGPTKVQFISNDTMFVYYDDGLVDHISVLRYGNSVFVELKNIGVMSAMSLTEWQALVKIYGNQNFTPSNYTTGISRNGKYVEYEELTKVSENIFVK